MHDEQNVFDTDSYYEFIQRQPYVDDTHLNHLLIIFEPSSNPLESQSQNAPSHFEIHDNEGDNQEMLCIWLIIYKYKWILRNRVHAVACRTSRALVKNLRAACRDMLILCHGMSLGACRSMTKSCCSMAITRFLKSLFFLYLVLNRVTINSQLL